jgi:peptidoglycan/LPS O-acetylase OafA/YrhL
VCINMRLFNKISGSAVAFIAVGVLSWVAIWWALAHQPTQIRLALHEPLIAQGTLGSDPEGVWFTGDTQVVVDRFADTPWRALQWRWRQAPGMPLTVQLQLESRQFEVEASPQWRVVRLLMPTVAQHTPLDIKSGTLTVAGDSRNLGVLVDQFQVVRLSVLPWWLVLVVGEYWLLIGVMALWLWRGRWLGVCALLVFSSVYVVLLMQEAQGGFGAATIWLDRSGRIGAVLLIGWWVWRHQRQLPVTEPVRAPSGRRFGLDVLRAVAVLSVVVSHVTPLLFVEWSSNRDIFRWLIYLGPVGVDIFFALSGYLIGGIVLRMITQFNEFAVVKRFWMRRWLRTLPAAYVSAVVVWLVAPPLDVQSYVASILFVGTVNPADVTKELLFWWSLAAEELFYLVLPLLVYVIIKKYPALHTFLISLVVIGVSAMLARAVLLMVSDELLWRNINLAPYARLDSMIWGVLMVWVRNYRPQWFMRLVQSGFAPGMVIFAAGVTLLVDQQRWDAVAMFIGHTVVVIGASLLIPVCESLPPFRWALLNRVCSGIALVSYSAYLYHGMMVTMLERWFGAATSWPMLGGVLLLYMVIVFGVATVSYRLVEAPVLRWRDAYFPDQRIAHQNLSSGERRIPH